jgi:hypothetical protein
LCRRDRNGNRQCREGEMRNMRTGTMADLWDASRVGRWAVRFSYNDPARDPPWNGTA